MKRQDLECGSCSYGEERYCDNDQSYDGDPCPSCQNDMFVKNEAADDDDDSYTPGELESETISLTDKLIRVTQGHFKKGVGDKEMSVILGAMISYVGNSCTQISEGFLGMPETDDQRAALKMLQTAYITSVREGLGSVLDHLGTSVQNATMLLGFQPSGAVKMEMVDKTVAKETMN